MKWIKNLFSRKPRVTNEEAAWLAYEKHTGQSRTVAIAEAEERAHQIIRDIRGY